MSQMFSDNQREDEIERHRQSIVDNDAEGNRQQADWNRKNMEALIAERSPEQVKQMECERGLR